MTGPSSRPRSEHTPRPGVTWDTELVSLGEIVVDIDRDENPFGWSELDTPPRPNRQTRRALARAARRKK